MATVTLNRPEKLNATTQPMMKRLQDIFAGILTRPDVSVVILKGEGRAFCARRDVGGHIEKPPHALDDPFLGEQQWVLSSGADLRRMSWEIP